MPKEQAENKIFKEKLAELNKKVPRSYRIKERSNCQEGGVPSTLPEILIHVTIIKMISLIVIQIILNLLR